MPLEKRYGRLQRARLRTDHQLTVRKVLAPRLRRLSGGGPRILFISTRGSNFHQLVDGVIAHGLQLRGAECSFFTCAGGLSLCDLAFEHLGVTPKHCDYCTDCSLKTIEAFGNPRPYTLRGLLSDAEIKEWSSRAILLSERPWEYVYKGVPVGELVALSLRHFLCLCTLPETPKIRDYWARMAVSACMLVDAFERLLERAKPDRIFMFNGLGFPEKVMRFLAERAGIPYTTYEMGLRPRTLGLAHNDVSNLFELGKEWRRFSDLALTREQSGQLDEYIGNRWEGRGGLELYWPSMQGDKSTIRARLNVPEGAQLVTAFTNIIWDTAAQEQHLAFPSMLDWLKATIEYFGKHRPNDILCIRAHPAEAKYWVPSNERVMDELGKLDLPKNLRIIAPEEDISSYEIARMSDLGLSYISTIGMEMAVMGGSVVVAGKPHYHGKGFTYSPETEAEYFAFLAPGAVPAQLDPEQHARARRYAYSLWFRFGVEFPFVTIPAPAQPELFLEQPELLEPGRHEEFDLWCQAILEGKDVLTLRWEAEHRSRLAAGPIQRVSALA